MLLANSLRTGRNPSLELLPCPRVRAGIAAPAEHAAHKSPGFYAGFSIPPISSNTQGTQLS